MVGTIKKHEYTDVQKKFLEVLIAKNKLNIEPDDLLLEAESYISNKSSFKSNISNISNILLDSCIKSLKFKEATLHNMTEEFIDLISIQKGGSKWTKLINKPSGNQSRNF